jgi:Kef-type K+ transport system membrane component KefB
LVTDATFLQNLGLIVVAAALFSLLGRRFRLPAIVSFLIAGLALGPLGGLIRDSEALDILTETGIVLLLFLVGLELNLERIREVGRVALIAGSIQIAVTAALGFGLSWLLGFEPLPAAILSAALSISSTVVVVKMLVERDESSSKHGQAAIGILLVQDIFVILLLTILTGLGGGQVSGAGVLTMGLLKAFGGMLALMAAMLVASRFLLPRPFAWAGRSRETIFIWSLSWCFLVVMGAHALQLSHEIGAFLAGVSLAQLPHSHDLQRRVRPLMNFFVAVFFVTLGIGMRADLPALLWAKALVLALFVIVGKFLIILWIARRLRFPPRQAFLTAILLTQISEFSFILAAMATKSGLAIGDGGDVLGLVGMFTITTSSVLIGLRETVYRFLNARGFLRSFPNAADDKAPPPNERTGHIIIVGMNTLGRELARRLAARGECVVATDVDLRKLQDLPCVTVHGDAESPPVLREAGLVKAKLLVSTLHIEATNDLLAFRCKVAGIPAAIHAANLREVANLLDMGVAYMMAPKVDGIHLQNAELTRRGLIGHGGPSGSRTEKSTQT